MARTTEYHRVLTNGVGKCSKPMWRYGIPDGFCDEPAYGMSDPKKYAGYVPALACPAHGGPSAPSQENGVGK